MELNKTGYFVLPAEDQDKYKSTIVSNEAYEVIVDQEQNVLAVNGKTTADKVGLAPELQEDGTFKTAIFPSIDITGKALATLADGRKIVHVIVSDWITPTVKPFLDPDVTDTDNPLDPRQIAYLGFTDKFIGYTREDVFNKFPELIGTKVIGQDEDGNDIVVDKLTKHKWSGEAKEG